MRPGTSLVSLIYRIGRISPEAVTVCFSSGLLSILTVTTSGSSLRLASTLIITTVASTTPTTTPIIIFFFLLNAILWVPSVRTGLQSRSSLYGQNYQTVSFKSNQQTHLEAQTFEMVAALTVTFETPKALRGPEHQVQCLAEDSDSETPKGVKRT